VTSTTPALPPAYAHFQAVFERLSDPLRAVLAGQLAQLEALLRLVDEPVISQRGDMAGLGGLTRHGDLSNILQSELLLRTEAPLEFLRRVAEAETLYHEAEYLDDGSKRVLRLMISVGPGTLGHGRIFCLAALFFLARIAHLRKQELHWCFLPNATGPVWFDEISVNTVKRFLKTASFREMSLDDAETARDIWLTLHAAAGAFPRPHIIDWLVGAHPANAGPRSDVAVVRAPRAIGFRLDPPVPQDARAAHIFLRRGGKDHRPTPFTFPDDAVCLSALNKPFAPIKPEDATVSALPSSCERMEHWAPRYITAPSAKAKLVRMEGGVLILFDRKGEGFAGSYFFPLETGVMIAGIRLKDQNDLMLLGHDAPEGIERLIFHAFHLDSTGDSSKRWSRRQKDLPCAQLFRTQHAYALPMLVGDVRNPSFHATNGKAFSLGFHAGDEVRFSSDRDAPSVIYANGQHRIIRTSIDKVPILQAVRANGSTVHDFAIDGLSFDETRLIGMLYSANFGQLAYSVKPNVWTLPGTVTVGYDREVRQLSEALHCEFAAYEMPLAIRRSEDDVHATIFSDARRGGDGCLRTVHIRHERVVQQSKLFDLGEDGFRIAETIVADDGIWAITADADGTPEALIHYQRNKGRSRKDIHRFDLAALRDTAHTIKLGD
jgi:hypothetical protein